MSHAGKGCTPSPLRGMLENVQHLQPQPAGNQALVWLLPPCQEMG